MSFCTFLHNLGILKTAHKKTPESGNPGVKYRIKPIIRPQILLQFGQSKPDPCSTICPHASVPYGTSAIHL